VAVAGLAAVPASRPTAAQAPAPLPTIEPLVTTEWLQREVGRPDLVILQLGGAQSFAKGHLPGAVALDYEREVVGAPVEGGLAKWQREGRYVAAGAGKRVRPSAAAGVRADEAVATYCHLGVQASWMYFTMRVLGRDVRMYDGSFDEWSTDASLPVEAAKARP